MYIVPDDCESVFDLHQPETLKDLSVY